MEIIFCFCDKCLKILGNDMHLYGELPAVLNAYTDSICALCDTEGEMAGTRKFEVELGNVEMKEGVHQYTEFSVHPIYRGRIEVFRMQEINDRLVLRMKSGDMTAFDELYAQNYDSVYQNALRMLHNPQDAQEATNDAFLQVWKAFTNWDPEPRNFGAWLNTIARNAIVTYYHRIHRKRDVVNRLSTEEKLLWVENTYPDPVVIDPLEIIVSEELAHQIEEALLKLPDENRMQRIAWMLRYFEGYPFKKIAKILSIKNSTAKMAVYACNQKLQRILRVKGVE